MKKLLVVVVVGLTVSVAGCGGDGKIGAKGRVVKGGKPFTVAEDDFVRVQFIPYTEPGVQPKNSFIADYDNKEGTFKALGPDLHGVPPGKYRLTIAHEKKKRDMFKGAYDLAKTPFVVDVDSSSKEIVIDLDKPPAK